MGTLFRTLSDRVADLNQQQIAIVMRFIDQVVTVYDPDAIQTFLRWKEEPILDTILLLNSMLSADDRYQVLKFSEELLGMADDVVPPITH